MASPWLPAPASPYMTGEAVGQRRTGAGHSPRFPGTARGVEAPRHQGGLCCRDAPLSPGCCGLPGGRRGPVGSGQGHVSQPREVAARWHCRNAGAGVTGRCWGWWPEPELAPSSTVPRVKHLSRALPGHPCAQGKQGCLPVPPSQAHQSPPQSPAAGTTGHGSGCERAGGPSGVLQRGFSAPSGVTPPWAGNTPLPSAG